MKFNQSTPATRFLVWSKFTKGSRDLKEALIKSIEINTQKASYYLVPIRAADLDDASRIKLLCSWRNTHQYAYPSRFTATDKSTKLWFEKSLLNSDARMMYWVTDQSLNVLGHIGFLLNDEGGIEVDNVLKGVAGNPGLFTEAMKAIEHLARKEFGVENLSLKVLEDNSHAIKFYEGLGYSLSYKIGMRWEDTSGGRVLVKSEHPDTSLNRMTKVIQNKAEPPELILTAGPSISAMEIAYVNDAVTSGWNAHHGDYIKSFEAEFAERLGVKHAMATSSCTGALHIALLALGIGVGDEVIVPDITWVATASAVAYTGATPVFADVDRKTWNISVDTIKSLLTSKTKAIIPVHLYGFAAPMVELLDFVENRGISIVEDAAPAIGTEVGGRFAGTFGEFGCFSFQGAKLLVTGEGGMLVTNNTNLYEKAWKIQDHGRRPGTFWIEELGHKYKMNNITAALGLAQITRADAQINRKREINSMYKELLSDLALVSFQEELLGSRSICWMTSITLSSNVRADAKQLSKFLAENGVDTRPVFPTIHSYPMWKVDIANPNAAEISLNSLNLPSGVELSDKSIEKVCALIEKWVITNA
jgi:perosamine synthetase